MNLSCPKSIFLPNLPHAYYVNFNWIHYVVQCTIYYLICHKAKFHMDLDWHNNVFLPTFLHACAIDFNWIHYVLQCVITCLICWRA
jgi:hypothetical protein